MKIKTENIPWAGFVAVVGVVASVVDSVVVVVVVVVAAVVDFVVVGVVCLRRYRIVLEQL